MKRTMQFLLAGCMLVALSFHSFAQDADLSKALESIRKVDKDGIGHEEAVKAMKILNAASPDQIPLILAAMDGANKLAVNWMRSAVVSIVGRSDSIPTNKIKSYFEDKTGSHLGRLMAFDLLSESVDGWGDSVVEKLIDDPSLPLRYKAVKAWIEKADSAEQAEAIGLLGVALEKARDVAQVQSISTKLGERGIRIDLQNQLGFLNTWHIVGCFNNKDEGGFDVAYGPESTLNKIDLSSSYEGLDSEKVEWSTHATVEPTGVVDLNEIIGKVKGVSAYAVAEFLAEEDGECEIRVGCINAHKVWVNGELVMANEVYHNGISPDKFSAPAKLVKGDNQIMIKVCQNEQTQPWAQRWMFQVRICDETGKAIKPAKPAPQQF